MERTASIATGGEGRHKNSEQSCAREDQSIPAKLRQALRIMPGDRLIARQEDDRLVLEKANAVERRLRALFAHIPPDVSFADELIAERGE